MLSTSERNDATRLLSKAGLPAMAIRRLLSLGSRLHRLSEAQCNGDWPADNGSGGETCPDCQSIWRTPFKTPKGGTHKVCPDCYATAEVRSIIKLYPGFGAIINGDPRGAVLLITTPDNQTNDFVSRGVVCG